MTLEYQLAGSRASRLCPSIEDLERDGWERASAPHPRYGSVWMRRRVRGLGRVSPVRRTKARRTAIRRAREERGLTRPEAAALAGISVGYLKLIETGARRVTFALRSRLLAAWGLVPILPPPPVPEDDDTPLAEWARSRA